MPRIAFVLASILVMVACSSPEARDATTTTEDSRVATGADAGSASPDSGSVVERDASGPRVCGAGVVQIEESCPTFDACGGELPTSATLCYRSVCIERAALIDAVFGTIRTCDRSLIRVTEPGGTVNGTLRLESGLLTRQATTSIRGSFYVPLGCALNSCPLFESGAALALGANGTAVCRAAAGGCDCDITVEGSTDASAPYTVVGSRLDVATEPQRSLNFCVDASGTLTFRDVSATDPEPGDQVFTY